MEKLGNNIFHLTWSSQFDDFARWMEGVDAKYLIIAPVGTAHGAGVLIQNYNAIPFIVPMDSWLEKYTHPLYRPYVRITTESEG